MKNIAEKVSELNEFLIETRRYIHKYPELSLKEYKTSKYLQGKLDQAGIPYQVVDGRSIVAEIRGARPGKTLGLRGDMDALPIQENTGLEFASVNPGVMHACGHDCHPAMLLTAGLILNGYRDQLSGTIKLIFQEAEEVTAGAQNVIDSGLVDDVDSFAALHMNPLMDTGKFSLGYGMQTSSSALFDISIRGVEGHSSMPHTGVNALTIAAKILGEIESMSFSRIDRRETVVITPTILNGGTKNNIIPGRAELTLNSRYFNDYFDEYLKTEVGNIVSSVAALHGATAEFYHKVSVKGVKNDDACVDRSVKIIKEIAGEDAAIITEASMASEDFAMFSRKAPSVFIFLGSAKDGKYYMGHHENTQFDEDSLPLGVEFLVRYSLDFLSDQAS